MLHRLILDAAADDPAAPALFHGSRTITFGELRSRLGQAARTVATRTSPGARVGVLSWNRPEMLELLYAIPAAGRIAVPLNARLHPRELGAQLARVGAELLIGESDLLAACPFDGPRLTFDDDGSLERAITAAESGSSATNGFAADELAADPAAVAWIIFTSGSTGTPKGAMLTHASLLAAVDAASGARPVRDDDCYLYPFPLFHVSAYNVLIQHRHRRPVVLLRSFDAAGVLAACRAHAVTTMSLAPTMITMLLDHPGFTRDALAGVHTIGYGASAIGEPLLRRVLSETDCGLSQGYGMTELSGNACYLDAAAHRLAATTRPELLHAAGRPAPGVEVRLAADGEILVRGAQVMAGYWDEPDLSARTIVGGWLHTGDLGRIDDDGYLYVIDRKKDLIISGGENVASREVEDVLARHPAVRQVAVVGVPDERWGEAVCALVVLRAGAALGDPAELRSFARERLAGYKSPRHVLVVGELPVNAGGKIDKPALRALAAERLGR